MSKIRKIAKTAVCALTILCVAAPFSYAYKEAKKINGFGPGTITVSTPAQNSNYDTIINDAKKALEEAKKNAAEKKKEYDSLTVEYDNMVAYIKELDDKQAELAGKMADVDEQIRLVSETKAETEEKLAEATEKKEEQYKVMCARIKYVYENGETSYFDILLNSGDITKILNRFEYVSEITKYDEKLLTEYMETVKTVSEYNDQLAVELETLNETQKAYEEYYELSKQLIESKNKALEECAKKKNVALDVYSAYMEEIETNQMTIEQAEKARAEEIERERKAAEEAAKKEAERLKQIEAEKKKQQQQQQQKQQQSSQQSSSGVTLSDNASLYSLIWPGVSHRISSYFGRRNAPTAGASTFHKGVDIACAYGTPIYAAAAGKVVSATYNNSCGNFVIIDHGGFRTVYMHASKLNTTVGSYVKQGQVIAYVGSTGISTGPHIHFAITINGEYVNPLNYVQ